MTLKRPHFGEGALALVPEKSVFINCPFDSGFTKQFDAILFAVACCGFMPRSALETGTVAISRMDRIKSALVSSRYSIHDLSRCTGQGDQNLARFNMPLELGMAMARGFGRSGATHDWMVMVPAGHAYERFVSDLVGYDPPRHNGTENSVIEGVVLWLVTRRHAVREVTPDRVQGLRPLFRKEKRELMKRWRGAAPPWADIVQLANRIARKL